MIPASPTIERPGSIPISGILYCNACAVSLIASVISDIPCSIGKLSSPSTYLIPKPPPMLSKLTSIRSLANQLSTILAVLIIASVPSI